MIQVDRVERQAVREDLEQQDDADQREDHPELAARGGAAAEHLLEV